MPQEAIREAHVPTKRPQTGQTPRVPAPHVDQGRTGRVAVPTPEGPTAAVGLIGRITDRTTFVALRTRARRARSGPVTIAFVASPGRRSPGVAYAIGRTVGPAVARNRLRRRLRSIVTEVAASSPGLVPLGAYLISMGTHSCDLGYVELKQQVISGLEKLARPVGGHG